MALYSSSSETYTTSIALGTVVGAALVGAALVAVALVAVAVVVAAAAEVTVVVTTSAVTVALAAVPIGVGSLMTLALGAWCWVQVCCWCDDAAVVVVVVWCESADSAYSQPDKQRGMRRGIILDKARWLY